MNHFRKSLNRSDYLESNSLTSPTKKTTKLKKQNKSYPQLEESVDVCVKSWHFLALALRRSVAHIPFILKTADWLEWSQSKKREPIELCCRKRRWGFFILLGVVVFKLGLLNNSLKKTATDFNWMTTKRFIYIGTQIFFSNILWLNFI